MSQPPIDPDLLMDEILERLRQQEVPPMPESLLNLAVPPVRHRGTARFLSLRAWTVRRPARLSAAAWALAATGVLLAVFLLLGPFGQRASLAFGDVQKAIGAARSMTYQWAIVDGDDRPLVVKVACLGIDRSRADFSDGQVQILNEKEGEMMTLSHTNRSAVIQSMDPSPELSKMRTKNLMRLTALPQTASRRIGEREYQGRKVIDFFVTLDDRDDTVSVDVETKLPVRMELVTEKLAATGRPHHELWTDFVFDAPLDESLFALVPPPGYTVRRIGPPPEKPPAENGLVLCSEDGIGPVRFGMTQDQIVKLLGKPDQITTSAAGMPPQPPTGSNLKLQPYESTELNYDGRGFALSVSSGSKIGEATYPGHGLLGIWAFSPADRLPGLLPFQGETKEGIHLGATPDEVLKVYGKPESKNQAGSLERLGYPNRGWTFEFRHGRLASITMKWPRPADEPRPGKTYVEQPVPAIKTQPVTKTQPAIQPAMKTQRRASGP